MKSDKKHPAGASTNNGSNHRRFQLKDSDGRPRMRVLITGMFLAALFASMAGAQEAAPDAKTLLKSMAQVYAGCTSYEDDGVFIVRYIGDGGSHSGLHFHTAFRRQTYSQFEYYNGEPIVGKMKDQRAVQRNTSGVWSWSGEAKEKKAESSLEAALVAATNEFGKTACVLPGLLLPSEIQGRKFTDDSDWTFLPDEEEWSRKCYRLTHTASDGATETLWIDKKSRLLLRRDETCAIQGKPGVAKVEQETHYYRARLNGRISDWIRDPTQKISNGSERARASEELFKAGISVLIFGWLFTVVSLLIMFLVGISLGTDSSESKEDSTFRGNLRIVRFCALMGTGAGIPCGMMGLIVLGRMFAGPEGAQYGMFGPVVGPPIGFVVGLIIGLATVISKAAPQRTR